MPVDTRLHDGLLLLLQARAYAQDAGQTLWDFALRLHELYNVGMTISDLRWLVAKGFVEHGQEVSLYGQPHRSFHRGSGFFFDQTTCLVLTASGATLAEQVLTQSVDSRASTLPPSLASAELESLGWEETLEPDHKINGNAKLALTPHWDPTRRRLSLAGTVVKQFRVPARNQEAVLHAFQEEGWPQHIDDPLPVNGDIDPPTRLHDAINRLNGCQANPLIRFHGNGSGTGVSWELRRRQLIH